MDRLRRTGTILRAAAAGLGSRSAEHVRFVAVTARLVGINHVALEVDDVDEALEWYRRIFAFELRGRAGRNMAFIDMGDQFLALSAPRAQRRDDERRFGRVVGDKDPGRRARREGGAGVVAT